MDTTILIVIIGAAVLIGGAGMVLWIKRSKAKKAQLTDARKLSGSTEMMGSHELRQRESEGDHALVLGELIDPDNPTKRMSDLVADFKNESSFFFGPPGSGKTAFLLAPNIIRHDGPVFASTTKADIIQATLRSQQVRQTLMSGEGQEHAIAVFDPAELLEETRHATGRNADVLHEAPRYAQVWTPISEAVTWPRAQAVAKAMLTAVESNSSGDGGGNAAFFTLHSTTITAALLLLARTQRGSTLYDVLDRVEKLSGVEDDEPDEFGEKVPDPWEVLSTDLKNAENAISAKLEVLAQQNVSGQQSHVERLETTKQALRLAHMGLKSSVGTARAGDTKAGIIGAIGQLTTGWTMSPKVMDQRWDDEGSFRLEQLPASHSVYLTCPTTEHRPLANAFLGAYMGELQRRAARAGGRLPRRHLVVLDELVYCTPHSDMPSWANNVARSAGIKLVLGTQAMSDLETVWGETRSRSLFNACKGSKVLMPGCTDEKALQLFEKLAGKKNLVQVSSVAQGTTESRTFSGLKITSDDGKVSKSTSETITQSVVEKDTASAARLAAMPSNTALAWLPGEKDLPGGTVQIRTLPYFEEGTDLSLAAQGNLEAVVRLSRPPSRHARSVNLENPLSRPLRSDKKPSQ